MTATATISPPVTKTPPPKRQLQSLPSPFRWTLSQYREFGKTNLFHDVKTFLIDGEIYHGQRI